MSFGIKATKSQNSCVEKDEAKRVDYHLLDNSLGFGAVMGGLHVPDGCCRSVSPIANPGNKPTSKHVFHGHDSRSYHDSRSDDNSKDNIIISMSSHPSHSPTARVSKGPAKHPRP